MKNEIKQAINLGYDGKLAIHPKQINIINDSFGIFDIEKIKHIVSTYEASGNAVCEIDGIVYEKFHINRYKKMLSSNN